MTNHIFHSGIKLTRECMPCMGMGQLRMNSYKSYMMLPDAEEVTTKPVNIDVMIVMCPKCEGNGMIIDHDTWMNFKQTNSPDVVYFAEQFINDEMKPEYL